MPPSNTLFQKADELAVDVIATEAGVAVGGQDTENAVVEFKDGNVKGSATQVVNSDSRAIIQSVQAVGQRRCGRLINNSFDREPSQLSGSLGGLTLQIIEVGGHRNDGSIDRISETQFGFGFELLENQAGDLLRLHQTLTDFQHRAATLRGDCKRKVFFLGFSRSASDQAFDGIKRALRE